MALTVNRGVALLLGRENSAKPRVPHRAMVVAEFRTVVLRKLSGAVTYGDVRHGVVCLSSVRCCGADVCDSHATLAREISEHAV